MKMLYVVLTFLILYCIPLFCAGQDVNLQNIKGQIKDRFKDKPFAIHGGISLSSVYSYSNDNLNNHQPFTYVTGGNLQLKIYRWSLPFSFTYSNKQFTRTNPNFRFNRLSLRPHYKKFKAYIGDFSLSFSPYSLNGFLATGGGAEYSPGKFKIQALYARFMKAVSEDSNGVKPSYKRMGWGVKTIYQDDKKKAGISVFHARDNLRSIPHPVKEANRQLYAREGTVIAFEAGWPVAKKLVVDAEWAGSVVTQDISYSSSDTANPQDKLLKKLVQTSNASTAIYHALKANLHYSIKQATVGIGYERIDPGYQSLGSYFTNNDFENMTLNLAHSLWKGKVTVGINAGLQRDDLQQVKQSRMKRVLFAGNVSAQPGKKTTMSLNYSGFQSYTILKTGFETIVQTSPYDNLDSLNFVQLSQNASLQISHRMMQRKEQSQVLNLQFNYMEAANKKGEEVYKGDVTRLITGNAGYTIQWVPQDLSVAAVCLYTWNYTAGISTYATGPGLTLAKSFFKKVLRTNAGINYNSLKGAPGVQSTIWNTRAGASATVHKKHNISFTGLWQKRTMINKAGSQYFTATAGYNYNF